MLIVAIKAARRGEEDWTTVATGTWEPGEPPKLTNKGLPASLIQDLFPSSVDPNDASGITTRDHREFTYCMEWRRQSAPQ